MNSANSTRTTCTAGRWPAYLNWSNELLGLVQADPHSWQVRRFVNDANRNRQAQAVRCFKSWNYQKAASQAYRSYLLLVHAANWLGIEDPTLMQARCSPERRRRTKATRSASRITNILQP